MQLQYIFNSGFVIELSSHILLFDYYKGKLPIFDSNKPLYVFVSHLHHDHYNPAIYDIKHPNITYIIDENIDKTGIKVAPHQTYQIEDIVVKTLLSTDLGVAFIVEVEGKTIYHAGDLNWWHWEGEPEQDNLWQKETFQKEIRKIQDITFDLMMIPLDPRLETTATWGMEYILSRVKTKHVAPMHFFINTKEMLSYLDKEPLSQYPNILRIEKKGDTFLLD